METIAENIFPSSGSNSLGSRLRAILEAYMEKYRIVGEDGTKPLVLVVITDGTHSTSDITDSRLLIMQI